MIDLYLSVSSDDKDENLHVYLLEAANNYFNNCFKTNLKVNFNYKAQESDNAEVKRILDALAIERKISLKKPRVAVFQITPIMKVLTTRRIGSSRDLMCPKEHGIPCYCPPQRKFRTRFYGSNIYALFAVEKKVKCFVCDSEMDTGNLQDHFQKNCVVFNPTPVCANTFAA